METLLIKQRRVNCLFHAFKSVTLKTVSATNWQPYHPLPAISRLPFLTADSYHCAYTRLILLEPCHFEVVRLQEHIWLGTASPVTVDSQKPRRITVSVLRLSPLCIPNHLHGLLGNSAASFAKLSLWLWPTMATIPQEHLRYSTNL